MITHDEYVQRYSTLEVAALNKVAQCLSKQLSHTSNQRQRQFSCAVVQVTLITKGVYFTSILNEKYVLSISVLISSKVTNVYTQLGTKEIEEFVLVDVANFVEVTIAPDVNFISMPYST